MSVQTILVIGATGTVGGPVARQLRASGYHVRLLVRDVDNLPKHLQGKRAMVLGKQPHPLHLVAASDFGRMVSRAFQEPLAQNRIFSIQGPEALTLVEALRPHCSLLEPEKRVMTIPLWAMSVLATLFLGKQMRRTVQMMQVLRRYGELGDPTDANRLLGAPTTTLQAWCEQQRTLRSRESHISV